MSDHRDALGIDRRDLRERIERTREAPGPRADAGPVAILPRRVRALGRERRAEALLPALRKIGLEITAIDRREREAAGDQRLDLPARGLRAPPFLGGAVRTIGRGPLLRDPGGRQKHGLILDGGVVAAEIETQESRHGTFGPVGHVEQQIEGRARLADRPDLELRARGLAAERLGIGLDDLGDRGLLTRARVGRAAVDVFLDQFHHLGAARLAPLLRVHDLISRVVDQRIRQRVRRHFRLIIDRGRHRRGQEKQGEKHGGLGFRY